MWCYFFRDLDVGLTKVCLKTKTKVMKQNLGSLLFYKIRQVPVSRVPKFFEYWHHARIFFEWAIKPFLDTKGLFSLVEIYFHKLILWKVEIHCHTSSFFLRDRDFEKMSTSLFGLNFYFYRLEFVFKRIEKLTGWDVLFLTI